MLITDLPTKIYEELLSELYTSTKGRKKNVNVKKLLEQILAANKSVPSTVIQRLLTKVSSDTKKLDYLEVGCGYAFSLIESKNQGYNVKGVEPGVTCGFKGRYKLAEKLLTHFGYKPNNVLYDSFAESMSYFGNDSFDVVYSQNVLEHVDNIHDVLKESSRVLKPGGLLYMAVPNYQSYYEGHYNIFWMPYILLNKKIAKLYVRVLKRDDSYIDELNFITYRSLHKTAKKAFGTNKFFIMPHMDGAITKLISQLYYYQKLKFNNLPNKFFISLFVKNVFIRTISKPFVIAITHICIVLGMAGSLNLIYYPKAKI